MPKFPTVYACWDCHKLTTAHRICVTCKKPMEKITVEIGIPSELRAEVLELGDKGK